LLETSRVSVSDTSSCSTMVLQRVSKQRHGSVPMRLKRALGLPNCEPEQVGLDSEAFNKHTSAIRRQIEKGWSYGNAECVLKGNKLIYADTSGYQDVELKIPMSEKSLFRCFSMTKPVTAFGLLALWEEGKLSLDDPVAKYIPEFGQMKVFKDPTFAKPGPRGGGLVDAKRQITLRHLLTHTSGLAYGISRTDRSEEYKPTHKPIGQQYMDFVKMVESGVIPNLRVYCQELAKQPLRFQPGEAWEYSYGMDVIGRVLEVVSGLPLDLFLKRRVLKPIGMRDTNFFISPQKARKQLAALYEVKKPFHRIRFDGRRPEKSSWVKGMNARIFAGGGVVATCDGGLVSSMRDQAIFANTIANLGYSIASKRQVLKPSTVKTGCTDWLRLPSVTTHFPLKGWHDDSDSLKRGWAPFGITEDDCIYMGGMGYWSVNRRDKTVIVSFPSTMWDEKKYRYWNDEVDDIDGVMKKSEQSFIAKAKAAEDKAAIAAKKRKLSLQ